MEPCRSQPSSRWIKRKLPIRPLFHQTDLMGVIHNSAFFLWFEEGRLQILLEVLPFEEALDLGVAMPVVENVCQYHKPVRFGDPLVLYTTHRQQPVYEGKLVFSHSLVHEKQKTEVASGHSVTTLVELRTNALVKAWPESIWRRYLALR